MEKKLQLIQDQKIKELILLDNYLKSQKATEKQLSSLKKDQKSFDIKNQTKNISKECKKNFIFRFR